MNPKALLIISLLIVGCTQYGLEYPEPIENHNNSYRIQEDIWTKNEVLFDTRISVPAKSFIEDHDEHSHIKTLVIPNSLEDKDWPGANAIYFINIVPNLYPSLENYLTTICEGQTRIEPGKNYDMEIIKETPHVRVLKIHRNCVTDEGHYSVPDNTEYLIAHDDRVIKVRIDEEADAAAMERFELLMKTAEKSL